MNNVYKWLMLLMLFGLFLMPNKVNAFDDTYKGHEGCTYNDIAALKEKVKEARVSYDYDAQSLMTVTIVNIQKDFNVVDDEEGSFKYDANREIPGVASVSGYFDGQAVTLTYVASEASACSGENILITTVKLPRYNPYFGNKACEGIDPDKFSLCSKWYPTEISETKFLAKVEAYKDSLKEAAEKAKKEVKTEKTIIDIILDNYYYVLIGIVGVTIITIIILTIRNKNKRVL